jgi:hypothetical protein
MKTIIFLTIKAPRHTITSSSSRLGYRAMTHTSIPNPSSIDGEV